MPPGNPILIQLQNLSEGVSNARNTREPVAALGLLQKAVEGLLERLSVQSNEEVSLLTFCTIMMKGLCLFSKVLLVLGFNNAKMLM